MSASRPPGWRLLFASAGHHACRRVGLSLFALLPHKGPHFFPSFPFFPLYNNLVAASSLDAVDAAFSLPAKPPRIAAADYAGSVAAKALVLQAGRAGAACFAHRRAHGHGFARGAAAYTDYSETDAEQAKARIEALIEMP